MVEFLPALLGLVNTPVGAIVLASEPLNFLPPCESHSGVSPSTAEKEDRGCC